MKKRTPALRLCAKNGVSDLSQMLPSSLQNRGNSRRLQVFRVVSRALRFESLSIYVDFMTFFIDVHHFSIDFSEKRSSPGHPPAAAAASPAAPLPGSGPRRQATAAAAAGCVRATGWAPCRTGSGSARRRWRRCGLKELDFKDRQWIERLLYMLLVL